VAAAYWTLLLTATHLPSTTIGRPSVGDKFVHFGGYAILTLCVLAAWELTIRFLEPKHYFAVWMAGTLCAAVDEITQVPVGRTGDVNDWAADVLGIVAALIVFRMARMPFYRLLVGAEI
jgi:VanZ family protein